MNKRRADDGDVADTQEAISARRKAKVSSKYRRNAAPTGSTSSNSGSSAFKNLKLPKTLAGAGTNDLHGNTGVLGTTLNNPSGFGVLATSSMASTIFSVTGTSGGPSNAMPSSSEGSFLSPAGGSGFSLGVKGGNESGNTPSSASVSAAPTLGFNARSGLAEKASFVPPASSGSSFSVEGTKVGGNAPLSTTGFSFGMNSTGGSDPTSTPTTPVKGFTFGIGSSGSETAGSSFSNSGTTVASFGKKPANFGSSTASSTIAGGGFSFGGKGSSKLPTSATSASAISFSPSVARPSNTSVKHPFVANEMKDKETKKLSMEDYVAKRLTNLNKSFALWVSRNAANRTGCIFDPAMLDYLRFSAEIRDGAASASLNSKAPVVSKVEPDPPAPALDSSLTPAPFAVPAQSLTPALTLTSAPAPAPAPAPARVTTPFPTFAMPTSSSGSALIGSTLPLASSKTQSTGFTFNAPSTGSSAFGLGSSPPAFTGFQAPVGGFRFPVDSNTLPGGSPAEESDGMPKENPAEMARAEGEEDEEVKYQVRSKMYRLNTENTTSWIDLGVGVLRLMRNTLTDKRRIVLRNDIGKVLLNVAAYEGMALIKCAENNSIRFVGNVEGSGPTSLMLRVNGEHFEALHSNTLKLIPGGG